MKCLKCHRVIGSQFLFSPPTFFNQLNISMLQSTTCGQTPSTASTTMMHPSQMRIAVDTSEEKSTCPGESIRLIRYSSAPEMEDTHFQLCRYTVLFLRQPRVRELLRNDWIKLKKTKAKMVAQSTATIPFYEFPTMELSIPNSIGIKG